MTRLISSTLLQIVILMSATSAHAHEEAPRSTRIYYDSDVETPPPSPAEKAKIKTDEELNKLCAEGTLREFPHTEIRHSVIVSDPNWGDVWYAEIYSNWSGQMIRIFCWPNHNFSTASVFVKGEYLKDVEGELPKSRD